MTTHQPQTIQETITSCWAAIKKAHEKNEEAVFTSCDSNSYGWSRLKHQALIELAGKYQADGHKVSRSVRFEVTDWRFYPKFDLEKLETLKEAKNKD